MFADYHVHSDFSEDCKCPMEEMILRGIELGINEIAFTEHADHGMEAAGVVSVEYPAYFAMLEQMKEQYARRISLRRGVEFGIQVHTIPLFKDVLRHHNFDFVIMSNHQVDNKEFWRQDFQKGKTQEEVHLAYYNEIYQVIKNFKDYSVLGHLDMIKRYDLVGDYPDEKIMDIVEQIFRQVIEDGKGIEVNTSCFRYGLKDLTPSREILRLYHRLGGSVLTIGSDAHTTEQSGTRIGEVKGVLRDIGFKYFCTFKEMKPEYHKL